MRVSPCLRLMVPCVLASAATIMGLVGMPPGLGERSAALLAGGGALSVASLIWFALEFRTIRKTARAGRVAMAKLEESQTRLQMALRNAAMGTWNYIPHTGELACCSVVKAMYGYGPDDEFTHEIASQSIHPDDFDRFFAAIEAARAGNTGFHAMRRILRRDGEWRWVATDGCWVRGSEEEGLVLVGVCRDVTEVNSFQDQLRQARDLAERANEAKSRFLAAASHDLRQPLQALSLYQSVLRTSAIPAQETAMAHMETCLGSLNALLNDLLDLSKLDSGVVAPSLATFPLERVLHDVILSHQPEAGRKGLSLRVVPTSAQVHSDPVLLQRIVGNLVANAVRYTETGGVVVGCRRRRGRMWLEVADSGIGIPADQLDAIFEEFLQLQNPERSREKGTGLGLAIVRKTANLLGIRIDVRSHPGCGSVFSLELPGAAAITTAAECPPPCR